MTAFAFATAQANRAARIAAHRAEKAASFSADLEEAKQRGADYYAAFRAEAIAIISAYRSVPEGATDADLIEIVRSI